MFQRRRKFLSTAAAFTAAPAILSGSARGQAYPSRPVRWVIQYAAGGTADIGGRAIAEAITGELGQQIVIEPKPGANTTIAAGYVASSPPDGYTWLLATLAHVVAPSLQPTTYHPVDDFVAAARLGSFSSIAVVPSTVPATTMTEFIAYARTRPGALNYFNSGSGSSMHLNTELLKLHAGLDLVPIGYKGLAAGIVDLINGRLDFGFSTPPLVLQHIQAGRLRALGVVSPQRLPELPDVPTFTELGLSDIQLDSWFLLLAPAKTPPEIIARFNGLINAAIAKPDVRQRVAPTSLGAMPPLSPAETQEVMRREYVRMADLIKRANIKADQ